MKPTSLGQLFCSIVQTLEQSSTRPRQIKQEMVAFEQEAMWILEHVLKQNKAQILLSFHESVPRSTVVKVNKILSKRLEGMPIQYILKSAAFGPLNLFVDQQVLIPRIETESWCQWLLELIKAKQNSTGQWPKAILDLCTGSGAIGLFLASQLENTKVTGSDIGPQALSIAKKNKRKLKLKNIKFYKSDLFDQLPKSLSGKFDIICSNPPYIAPAKYQKLDLSVRNYEPMQALVADYNGMEFYNKILLQSAQFLTAKNGFGWLVLEYDQYTCEQVCKQASDHGFKVKQKFVDLFGKPRAIILNF